MSFKLRLLISAALPLAFTCIAEAQEITTPVTEPVRTSTANAGQPGNVSITTAGSVTLTSRPNTSAVTIDSNNTVTNAGTIAVVNSDNAVGLRILSGLAGGYTGAGAITVLEDYTRTDADGDGDLDGPLAQGVGRYGILLAPGGALTGDIRISGGGRVEVEGNNSAAVSLQSNLIGNYRQFGTASVTGSNSYGVDIQGDVSGDILIQAFVNAQGEGSTGMRVLGDVGGEFQVGASISATGFTSTTTSNYVDPDTLRTGDPPISARRDADDLLVGGPALRIAGNLARGLLVNGAATGGVDTTPDVKDAIQNFNEDRTDGFLSSFGSAPALLIQSLDGAAGGNIVLSLARESVRDTTDDDADGNVDEIIGVFNYDHGFVNRGQIIANGFNVGFRATAIDIRGSNDGQYTTTINGGMFLGGSVTARSFEADSRAIVFGAGAVTPRLDVVGAVSSTVFTETDHDAFGLLLESGARVPALNVSGSIISSTRGYDGDAVGIRDLSGNLVQITNSGRIAAGFIDDDVGDDITSGAGRAIAIDVSRNTSGVSFTQSDTRGEALVVGDVLFGSGADRLTLASGRMVGDVSFGLGADVLSIGSATLTGDVSLLGAGSRVSIDRGTLTGNLGFGAAGGVFSLSNGAVFDGALTSTAGDLSVEVNGATLRQAAATSRLGSLSALGAARLAFSIDRALIDASTPVFEVSGAANLSAGTRIAPIFDQFLSESFTLRLLRAGSLTLGGSIGSMLDADLPFIYQASLATAAGGTAIDLSLRPKTPAELGLTSFQAASYGATLDLLANEDAIGAALSAIDNQADFSRAYTQLTPQSDAALLRILETNATAAFGATARRLDLQTNRPEGRGAGWAEEFGVYHTSDAADLSPQASGGGFGVAAGYDFTGERGAVLGAFLALESIELEEKDRRLSPFTLGQYTFGGYGGRKFGALSLNGVASVGFADFSSTRRVEIGDFVDTLSADWKGMTLAAAARATYTFGAGPLEFKPFLGADILNLRQDARRETSASDLLGGIDAGEADSTLATASYGATLAGRWGRNDALSITPEVSVGYRNVLSFSTDPATARFRTGGPDFQLAPGREPENALTAGLGFNLRSQFLNLNLGYDGEFADGAATHYGSVTLRFSFW